MYNIYYLYKIDVLYKMYQNPTKQHAARQFCRITVLTDRNSMARTLPDFDNPPAVETALGVRFATLPGWNVFHYGLMLQEFREDYPKQELRLPIGIPVTISFPPADSSDFAGMPVRCWFVNQQSTELIQVQSDYFVRNWRKLEHSQQYLHYEEARPKFERDWLRFLRFLTEQRLPIPDAWQCEIAYVNQFVRGREWKDFDQLDALYPIWRKLPGRKLLSQTQTVNFVTAYQLPNNRGVLQFSSQPAIRKDDGAEIIQLTVNAIGKPDSSTTEGILNWLDDAHAAVVEGFKEFTSDEAHKIWRMK
jgi:uncharacterized protein (TIGR04255 family)